MNKFVFDDAITLLDSDLIEKHIKEKERMSHLYSKVFGERVWENPLFAKRGFPTNLY